MIRKTCVLWKYISPVFSEMGFHSTNGCRYLWNSRKTPIRWCSNEPIFKIRKRIQWGESFEQQTCTEPETSSIEQRQYIFIALLRQRINHKSIEQYLYFDCANRFPYLNLCTGNALLTRLSFDMILRHKLTLMHTWMVLVRLQSVLEVAAFIKLRNSVTEIMFRDVDKRLRVASHFFDFHSAETFVSFSGRIARNIDHKSDKRRIAGLYLQTFLKYDDGFLSDDTTLAGALWRNLYMQRFVNPVHLNRAVYYVRGTSQLEGDPFTRYQELKNCTSKKSAIKMLLRWLIHVAYSLMKQKYKHL
uniref:Ubiquinol-cytochrome c chaperone domain-containing protein n=1 Tax=Wuchereria bancrofti TaxID=6293 RepID=A0A1I8EV95_WUCBA